MTTAEFTVVLGWSMVVNVGILLVWVIAMTLMPKLTLRCGSYSPKKMAGNISPNRTGATT